MAQGDKWNIGISAFDRYANLAFREYDQIAHFLNAETSTGATKDIETADIDGVALDLRTSPYVVTVGSVLIFGPSSHADNLTATEEFTVESITATKVVGTLKFKYAAGDQITIRTIPKNWAGETTAVDGKLYERADGVGFGAGNTKTGIGYGAKISRGKSLSPAVSAGKAIGALAPAALTPTSSNGMRSNVPTTLYKNSEFDLIRTTAGLRKVIVKHNLSAVAPAASASLRLYFQNDCNGETLTIYRVKQTIDPDYVTYNNYANGAAWDGAGCATSGTDYHAGAVFSGVLTGSGWQTITLDAALMNEIIGAAPSKANNGLILIMTGTDTGSGEGFAVDMAYFEYEPALSLTTDESVAWASRSKIGTASLHSQRWLFKHSLAALVGKTIVSVRCDLDYTGRGEMTDSTYNIYRLKRDWTTDATWGVFATGSAWGTAGAEHADDAVAIATEQTANADEGGTLRWYLTVAEVTKMVDGTYTNYGFLIRETSAGKSITATAEPVFTIIYTDASDDTHLMHYTSNKGTVRLANGRHRLACYYKATGTHGACFFEVKEYDYAGTLKATNTYYLSAGASAYTLFTQLLEALNTDTAYVTLTIGIKAAVTAVTTFTVALVTLEHAYGTSDTGAGVLEVDKNPAFDGASFEQATGEKQDAAPNNTLESYDQSGGRTRWAGTSLEFRNVDFAQYDDMNELARQSTAGAIVLLRTWLSAYPAVMFGKFALGRPYHTMRNFAKVNIPARYTEIGV